MLPNNALQTNNRDFYFKLSTFGVVSTSGCFTLFEINLGKKKGRQKKGREQKEEDRRTENEMNRFEKNVLNDVEGNTGLIHFLF